MNEMNYTIKLGSDGRRLGIPIAWLDSVASDKTPLLVDRDEQVLYLVKVGKSIQKTKAMEGPVYVQLGSITMHLPKVAKLYLGWKAGQPLKVENAENALIYRACMPFCVLCGCQEKVLLRPAAPGSGKYLCDPCREAIVCPK